MFLMTEWVCRWKPFWIPSGDTFQKAYLEEWEHFNDEQSHVVGEDKATPDLQNYRIGKVAEGPERREEHHT